MRRRGFLLAAVAGLAAPVQAIAGLAKKRRAIVLPEPKGIRWEVTIDADVEFFDVLQQMGVRAIVSQWGHVACCWTTLRVDYDLKTGRRRAILQLRYREAAGRQTRRFNPYLDGGQMLLDAGVTAFESTYTREFRDEGDGRLMVFWRGKLAQSNVIET